MTTQPSSNDELDRYREAQAGGAFESALSEIRAGAKRGHWIWFILPQLAGLGASPMSQRYEIRNAAEAAAYVRDPVLGARLNTISAMILEQLQKGVDLVHLLSAEVDVLKLVSSMTLFEAIANRLEQVEHREHQVMLRDAARQILQIAESEGYPRCGFTLRTLQRGADFPPTER